MWRGGATAASAARAFRSRLLPDPIHNPVTSLAPVASARASSSSAPSAAASNTIAEAAAAAAAVSQQAGSVSDALRYYGRCYWELSKARLSALVVATSGAGYVLGSGNIVDIAGLCFTCTGTMMVAASANTLNQVFEIKNDAKMKRTMRRPLPSGRISPAHAAMWATSVGAAGTALLAWKTNGLAAGLAASNLVLYAFVYTPLKQIHPVNTWVGAIVGAIPPLLGGWLLDSGGLTSEWFGLEASLLTLGLTIGGLSFVLEPSPKTARRMFYGSLLYLPAFMAGLLLHRLPNNQKEHNLDEKSELAGILYGSDLQDEEREQDRNVKTENILMCNHALQLLGDLWE
ncbi:hypothetical protein PR202_gb05917 [Eleusine coracana subsp. coracana]|uniref:Heme O synthase n=2 Tax=Eleusine coracana subsp. coracana TaxID=191504 RepID=A0AAV5E887_ELECO|nr:hypothetical protein PR202_gb05917 [Eleusine coracana subsp. coracana]